MCTEGFYFQLKDIPKDALDYPALEFEDFKHGIVNVKADSIDLEELLEMRQKFSQSDIFSIQEPNEPEESAPIMARCFNILCKFGRCVTLIGVLFFIPVVFLIAFFIKRK